MIYNQYPYNIFNQIYVAPDYLKQIQIQKHNAEQQKKIADMVKAISDYCNAARSIDPSYHQEAILACLAEISRQIEIDQQYFGQPW